MARRLRGAPMAADLCYGSLTRDTSPLRRKYAATGLRAEFPGHRSSPRGTPRGTQPVGRVPGVRSGGTQPPVGSGPIAESCLWRDGGVEEPRPRQGDHHGYPPERWVQTVSSHWGPPGRGEMPSRPCAVTDAPGGERQRPQNLLRHPISLGVVNIEVHDQLAIAISPVPDLHTNSRLTSVIMCLICSSRARGNLRPRQPPEHGNHFSAWDSLGRLEISTPCVTYPKTSALAADRSGDAGTAFAFNFASGSPNSPVQPILQREEISPQTPY